jgi:hypothetical protein
MFAECASVRTWSQQQKCPHRGVNLFTHVKGCEVSVRDRTSGLRYVGSTVTLSRGTGLERETSPHPVLM